jgi:hypothetical protein
MAESEPEDAVPEAYRAAARPAPAPRRPLTRREHFLSRIEPVWDGPVLLATRIRPIDPARARAAACLGVGVRALVGLAGPFACLVLEAVTRNGAFTPAGAGAAALGVTWPALNTAVSDASVARHGPKYRYLTARTWTGLRSVDLSRLALVREKAHTVGPGTLVMDAEGVVLHVQNNSARKAIAQCAEKWGIGETPLSPAAARRMVWFALDERHRRLARLTRGAAAKLGYVLAVGALCLLAR